LTQIVECERIFGAIAGVDPDAEFNTEVAVFIE